LFDQPTGSSVSHHRCGGDLRQREGRVQRQGGRHSGLAVRQWNATQLGDMPGDQSVSDQQHEIPGQR